MPSNHQKSSNPHLPSELDQPPSLSWSDTRASSIVNWLEEIPRSTSPSALLLNAQPKTSALSKNEKALNESEEEKDEAEEHTISHEEISYREIAMPDLGSPLLPQPASSSGQTSSPSESESLVDRLEGAIPPVLYQYLESERVQEVSDKVWTSLWT